MRRAKRSRFDICQFIAVIRGLTKATLFGKIVELFIVPVIRPGIGMTKAQFRTS